MEDDLKQRQEEKELKATTEVNKLKYSGQTGLLFAGQYFLNFMSECEYLDVFLL